jgi:5'-nucleotidase
MLIGQFMFAHMTNNKRPLILVTNDDSISSKGILSLATAAMEFGDVVLVAPDKPQSGMGHAVTINGIIRLQEENMGIDVRAYSCSGTPVDCVKMAIFKVLDRKPDLLLSGINHGSNSSINVIYSGTMSAAVEGAVSGIPSIGFSLLEHGADADFDASMEVVRTLLNNAVKDNFPEGICLNVNIPKGRPEDIKGIRVCRQAKAYWEDNFDVRKDPTGKEYFWLTGEFKNFDKGEDTDEFALHHNYVSVVPVHYDLTAYHAISHLQQWKF